MSGLDGATVDQFTAGINTPADGEQGYVAFADQQTPYPNLEYKSLVATSGLLKDSLLAYPEAESAPGATIAANGSHQVNWVFPVNYGLATHIFQIRAAVYSSTALVYFVQSRLTVVTNTSGNVSASGVTNNEIVLGSGFSLSMGAATQTITGTLNSSTGTAYGVNVSISRTYLKQYS